MPGRQHHPTRVLVRRGEHRGLPRQPGQFQPSRVGPVVADRQRRGGQPRRVQDIAVPGQPGILRGHRLRPEPAQHLGQQRQPLREPGCDHHGGGVRPDSAGPRHVAGDRGAQYRQPGGRAVVQALVRDGGQGPADARSPLRSGKGTQVRASRPQVNRGPLRCGRRVGPSACRPPGRQIRHLRARAGRADQPPFRGELRVGLHHRAPGDAKISRQAAAPREPGPCMQPPRPDRLPQRHLQRPSHEPSRLIDAEMQVQPLGHPPSVPDPAFGDNAVGVREVRTPQR